MQMARSASRAGSPSRSAVETATTVSRPSCWQARMTRTAISPRLAIRTRRSVLAVSGPGAVVIAGLATGGPDHEQHLVVLDELGVGGAELDDLAGQRSGHRVHQLHD